TSDAPIQVVAEPDARVPFPTSKPLLGEGNRACGRGFFGFPPDQPMVRRQIARAASGGGWLAAAGDGRHLINRRGARAAPTGVGAGGGWLPAAGNGRHLATRGGARRARAGVGAARTRRV